MKKLVVLSIAIMLLVSLPALALRKFNIRTAWVDDITSSSQYVIPHNNPKLPTIGTQIGTTYMDWPCNGNVMNQISADNDGGIHFSWTFLDASLAGSSRRYMYNYRGADGSYLGPTVFADIAGARWGSSTCTHDGIGMATYYYTDGANYPPMFSYDAGAGLGVFTTIGIDTADANAQWAGAWWNRIARNRSTVNSDTIYVASQGPGGNGTCFNRSFDMGATWQGTWTDISFDGTMGFRTDFPSQQIAAGSGGRLAVAVADSYSQQIYRISEDYGATWGNVQIAVDPLTSDPYGDTVVPYIHTQLFFDNNNVLHIVNGYYSYNFNHTGDSTLTYQGILHWSENTGLTYVTRALASNTWYSTNALNDAWPNMCQTADGRLVIVYAHFDSTDMSAAGIANGEIYAVASEDGGATWGTPVNVTNSPTPGAAAGACEDDVYPDCVAFGDSVHIIWLNSPDAGQGWSYGYGTVTENYYYHAVIAAPPTGVNGGPATQTPGIFALNQNRPNPVTRNAEISFSLPRAGEYSLRVFNVAGQTVKEFRGQGKAGANSLSWNAKDAPAGIYFYKLTSGGNTATRKLVVVK